MDAGKIAAELSSGGAYTAWFVVVVLATAVVYLFREVRKLTGDVIAAYKEDDSQVLDGLAQVLRVQGQHTEVLATILGIIKAGERR